MHIPTPVVALYAPAPQGMHIPTPVVVLYEPAPQGVHAVPSDAALYPARQVHVELLSAEKVLFGHVVQFVDASDEEVFIPQDMHIPVPVVALYEPAPQGVHASPLDEAMYPARQVQLELFASEKELV